MKGMADRISTMRTELKQSLQDHGTVHAPLNNNSVELTDTSE